MTQFYFLRTSLPELKIEEPLPIGFEELMYMLQQNLSENEWELISSLRLYYDLQNLDALLKDLSIDHKGVLEGNALEKSLQSKEYFPSYVFDFFEEYSSKEEQIKNFGKIFSSYFKKVKENSKGLLHDYFSFERELRLYLLGYRCKKLNRDLYQEIQHEDIHDEIVIELIRHKDDPDPFFPDSFTALKEALLDIGSAPQLEHEEIAKFRFYRYNDVQFKDFFTIDVIILYVIQYFILDDLNQLSSKKGLEQFNMLIKEK